MGNITPSGRYGERIGLVQEAGLLCDLVSCDCHVTACHPGV